MKFDVRDAADLMGRADAPSDAPTDAAIDHPAHYGGDNPYETIKVLEAWYPPDDVRAFCVMNVIKYLSRAGKKGDGTYLQDLKKAAWYLQRAIVLQTKLETGP